MQDPKSRQKSPYGLHRTTLSGYIFATKACIDNRKKNLIKQQYLPYMSSQYGELRPTSGWDRFVSLGTPGNFNGFLVLAALLHGTLVVGVSQTAALNRGRHLYSAGRPSRWALAFVSSSCIFLPHFVGLNKNLFYSLMCICMTTVLCQQKIMYWRLQKLQTPNWQTKTTTKFISQNRKFSLKVALATLATFYWPLNLT